MAQHLSDCVATWNAAGDPDIELDLSGNHGQVLPPIPPAARNIDISDNELLTLPAIPAGTVSLIARDNRIKRLPDEFLESLFTRSSEGYFDFEGNPLEADQIGRIREVVQAPAYDGPMIIFSAPAGMVFDDEKDLTDVGKSKLVGYLPMHRLSNATEMAMQLQSAGLRTRAFQRNECGISTGALYAYDAARLAAYLGLPESRQILGMYGAPSTPDEFIDFIATTRVQKHEKRALFDLIALTFNNPDERYDGPV